MKGFLHEYRWFIVVIVIGFVIFWIDVKGASAQTPAPAPQNAAAILASAAMPNKTLIEAPRACAGKMGLLVKEVRQFCLELAKLEADRAKSAAKSAAKAIAPDSTSFGKAFLVGMALNTLAPRGYYGGYDGYGYGISGGIYGGGYVAPYQNPFNGRR